MTGPTLAILDPFSGIAGDMMLGALVAVGLDADWLRGLPDALRLAGVRVRVQEVLRGEIVCWKVDFDIPAQPHGRGVREIHDLLQAATGVPGVVLARAEQVFQVIAEREGEIHGVPPEEVHLHEVGAVDAILDIVGAVWGFHLLGVDRVHCGPIQLGDGFVRAAHGMLPVPAPATLRILEGLAVRPGPDGSGELVTPTGAALVKVLSSGPPPHEYVPRRSGFGAGTKDFPGRANALRLILAEPAGPVYDVDREPLVLLAADVDDATGEMLAAAADALREAGALDVVLLPTLMKKGRPGSRIEALSRPEHADRLEALVLERTSTIGVRRSEVLRRALPREILTVQVDGHPVRIKVVHTPDGGRRAKPEFDDVSAAARALGRDPRLVSAQALAALDAAD
ncbi:UPF0272 protein [Gemmatirosa kalamazoonensis]|uniref:Putative nickel insertion protein n=1 Tax=Gemmatirosa kalamazoonensis TaxID=861299 RepID=W0RKC9_9BACT|nr:nickel pincer cofactor biosynthesis protein LarC [Gemmatirosa kalamazoonensis]AHG90770.1 UPF0272 protein [Gemmatirosa kalamazoonensis]